MYILNLSAKFKKLFMVRYISSVGVILTPKDSSAGLMSVVLGLDPVSGSTILQAVHFVSKSPLVKRLFPDYVISNLTFKYSNL